MSEYEQIVQYIVDDIQRAKKLSAGNCTKLIASTMRWAIRLKIDKEDIRKELKKWESKDNEMSKM